MKYCMIEVSYSPADPHDREAISAPPRAPGPGGFIYRLYDVGWRPAPVGRELHDLPLSASGSVSGTDGAAAFARALTVARQKGYTHYLPQGWGGTPIAMPGA